jgi:hypothetical protein
MQARVRINAENNCITHASGFQCLTVAQWVEAHAAAARPDLLRMSLRVFASHIVGRAGFDRT